MLVLPYQNKFALRAVPWVTVTLVCVALWMFLLQRHDDARVDLAHKIYSESSLASLESARYRLWLQARADSESIARLVELDAALGGPAVGVVTARSIQTHPEFLRELRRGAVIKLDDPAYARWREDRLRFEAQLERSVRERLQLRADTGQPWRVLTYALVHTSAASLLLNVLVLLIAGAYAEHSLGRARFATAYLVAAACSGVMHLAFKGTPLAGAAGAVLATTLIVALHYRTRIVPTLFTVKRWSATLPVPPLMLLPIGLAAALMQMSMDRGQALSYWSLAGAVLAGLLLAVLLRPRAEALPAISTSGAGAGARSVDDAQSQRRGSLAREAREALMRMDTRRAVRLYRELVEDNPEHTGHLASYFNAAVMSHDPECLSDACLRVLWLRNKGTGEELRKVFLQMSQPSVLRTLPVDEQLRLTRRLVRAREDSAALKVLDNILDSPQLRQLYGRQIADCLLGLFTTYSRHGLKAQANNVRARLKLYFPQPGTIGGLAPNTQTPHTIRRPTSTANTAGPSTLFIDLS